MTARTFGGVRAMRGRWQARWRDETGVRRSAAFRSELAAWQHLAVEAERVAAARETADAQAAATGPQFGAYAAAWLAARPLEVTTVELYARYLRKEILPAFGDVDIREITPADIREWFARENAAPTVRPRSYALMHAIMADAAREEIIEKNPCLVKGSPLRRRTRPG